jgi:hypothetical protein
MLNASDEEWRKQRGGDEEMERRRNRNAMQKKFFLPVLEMERK